MSQKRDPDELKKLAHPALRHAELVALAKANTPTKAFELAIARWPRRQATACRHLAVLCRDFPEAVTAFITSSGHARPEGSEHVRGETCEDNTSEE